MSDIEREKIEALYSRWMGAVKDKDIEGYIDCLDESVTMHPPDGPAVRGHDGYRTFLKPVFEAASYDGTSHGKRQVEIIGSLAITRIHHTMYLNYEGDATSVDSEGALQKNVTASEYLDVLKKQDDGSWKCLVHTWREIDSKA